MELQKLRYFYTVAKFQHMTKAAEYLNIAQPALSQSIKSLEQELSVELFSKSGRNIVLTEYGEYLMLRLETLLPQIDSIPSDIDRMKNRVRKTVSLNILAATTLVIDVIVEFRKMYPDVVFDFEQNESRHDCDIVITTDGLPCDVPTPCIEEFVKEENIYLAVPNNSPYASMESLKLSSVRDEEFVLLSDARRFGVICNEFCRISGFYPKILFESDSPAAVQNIISTGSGVAFWPEYSWGNISNENVSLVPVSQPKCSRQLIIKLYNKLPASEYAHVFYDYLVDRINKI